MSVFPRPVLSAVVALAMIPATALGGGIDPSGTRSIQIGPLSEGCEVEPGPNFEADLYAAIANKNIDTSQPVILAVLATSVPQGPVQLTDPPWESRWVAADSCDLNMTHSSTPAVVFADTGKRLFTIDSGYHTIDGQMVFRGQGKVHGDGGVVRLNGGTIALAGTVEDGSTRTSGGGIYVGDGATLELHYGATVTDCRADLHGAGIAVHGGQLKVELERGEATVSGNVAGGNGGGLHMVDADPLVATGLVLHDNMAVGSGGGAYIRGGGAATSPHAFVDVLVELNTAGGSGGGLRLDSAGHVDISSTADCEDSPMGVNEFCTEFLNNGATSGGGIEASGGSTVTIDRASVRDNRGGGLRVDDSDATVSNSLFTGHDTANVMANRAAIRATNGSEITLSASTLADNAYSVVSAGSSTIEGLGVVGNNNSHGTSGGGISWTESVMTGVTFVTTDRSTYALGENSAGAELLESPGDTPGLDLDGELRPGTGEKWDAGALQR